jgi:hypothetical protein
VTSAVKLLLRLHAQLSGARAQVDAKHSLRFAPFKIVGPMMAALVKVVAIRVVPVRSTVTSAVAALVALRLVVAVITLRVL